MVVGTAAFAAPRFCILVAKPRGTVKAGSWSTAEPPPGGPITVLFSAKFHKKYLSRSL